jgi:hypothetical protein
VDVVQQGQLIPADDCQIWCTVMVEITNQECRSRNIIDVRSAESSVTFAVKYIEMADGDIQCAIPVKVSDRNGRAA